MVVLLINLRPHLVSSCSAETKIVIKDKSIEVIKYKVIVGFQWDTVSYLLNMVNFDKVFIIGIIVMEATVMEPFTTIMVYTDLTKFIKISANLH